MTLNFPHYCDLLNANSLKGWLAFFWDRIAILIQSEGNLALSHGVNVAQLRLEPQIQGSFNRIIPKKFQIHIHSGRYSPNPSVPS